MEDKAIGDLQNVLKSIKKLESKISSKIQDLQQREQQMVIKDEELNRKVDQAANEILNKEEAK